MLRAAGDQRQDPAGHGKHHGGRAKQAGLHSQTLRIYEREGLIVPARSPGGTRRYGRDDISRLHEICALTGDGLNMAGIGRVLQLQEETRQLQAELDKLRGGAARGPQELTPAEPDQDHS